MREMRTDAPLAIFTLALLPEPPSAFGRRLRLIKSTAGVTVKDRRKAVVSGQMRGAPRFSASPAPV